MTAFFGERHIVEKSTYVYNLNSLSFRGMVIKTTFFIHGIRIRYV